MLGPVVVHVAPLAEGSQVGVRIVAGVVIAVGCGQDHTGHPDDAELFEGRRCAKRTPVTIAPDPDRRHPTTDHRRGSRPCAHAAARRRRKPHPLVGTGSYPTTAASRSGRRNDARAGSASGSAGLAGNRGLTAGAGLDLSGLEESFANGSQVFVFSNPNNPTGVIYSETEVRQIAELASRYGATVIVDQLYSRLCYAGTNYTHLCKLGGDLRNLVTIMGPSKTESLSGYRLGVAFGSPRLIGRMEKLQAIVSLRAAGYNQSVLRSWFAEPPGWMDERIERHQTIRDHLHRMLSTVDGIRVRVSEAGSYLFPQLPSLMVSPIDFVRLLRVQANVIVTPGSEFGPHSADSIRLNFSQYHDKTIDAAERIVKLVERYRR